MNFWSRHGLATDRAVVTHDQSRYTGLLGKAPCPEFRKTRKITSNLEAEFRCVNLVKLEVYADCSLAMGSVLSWAQSRVDGSDCAASCGAIVLL